MASDGFDFEGSVPLAYMAFAMALALAAGALLRRAIPAMVVTLAGFLAVRLPIDRWARPYLYQTPITLTADPMAATGPTRADWVLDFGFADRAGYPLATGQVFNPCAPSGGSGSKIASFQCIQTHHRLFTYVYQPATRFWRFQFTETVI